MLKFEITNRASGQSMGIFEADYQADAVAAMLRANGIQVVDDGIDFVFENAEDETAYNWMDWVVVEVTE